ncbi:MAG: histidine--tRNA ligase [Candidatus Limnocylindrales bacterium]
MPSFQAPRGTRDLLFAERAEFARLESIARDLARRYGYSDAETPLFERSEVFERGLGVVTDVVEKELFRVTASRGDEGERWALRPEATAGLVRAYLQHGLHALPQPVRFSLVGPMFRYDRPQAGRFREFWQWDVEAIGDAGPAVDAELVELGLRFYAAAGLEDVRVHLNSIGDAACRPAYLVRLTAYLEGHAAELPEVERVRLATNPLRLLDSKDPAMAALIAAAPRLVDHLCDPCAAHFAAVRAHLGLLGIEARLAPTLVRGLDYYTRTAFEFYREGAEGQQQALGGGGRYDGLVELLGGKPTPGIGFALGLDRVVLALAEHGHATPAPVGPTAIVVGADPAATGVRLRLATDLRAAGLAVRADLVQRKLGRQLEGAARDGAHFAIIVGDELAHGQVLVRDLQAGTQHATNVSDLARELARAQGSHHHG